MTAIPWADEVLEVTAGCTKVSAGCDNCYACRLSGTRLDRHPDFGGLVTKMDGPNGVEFDWTGKIRLLEQNLQKPLHRRKPTIYFVNSRSDLFHPGVPDEYIAEVWATMHACTPGGWMIDDPLGSEEVQRAHKFVILTKRPERMQKLLTSPAFRAQVEELCSHEWIDLPTIWPGVSIEDQKTADERIPWLLKTPAMVRVVSHEPSLGPVDFGKWLPPFTDCPDYLGGCCRPENPFAETGNPSSRPGRLSFDTDKCVFGRSAIGWVIQGGESGPRARPMHPDWARGPRDQCIKAGVAYWFKQWGEWAPSFDFRTQFAGINRKTPMLRLSSDGHIGHSIAEMEGHPDHGIMVKTGAKLAGNVLDGQVWEQRPGDEGRDGA